MRADRTRGGPDRVSWLDTHLRAVWTAVAMLVAISALAFGTVRVTASPRLCSSCHEMRPKVDAWRTSGHAQVGCPSCHQTPRPWYQFPQTLAERGQLLSRDVRAHFGGVREFAATSATTSSVIPDSTCLHCHDPVREVTMRYGTLIDHNEHAERNGSCVSCHLWTAHPRPGSEKPLLLMEQCFSCHGNPRSPDASADCGVCHPPSFDKRPVSHAAAQWNKAEHGATATRDRQQCVMCHKDEYCRDCHGLEMPHPAGWEKGKTGHGPLGTRDHRVCDTCHPKSPDFCSMCHHEGYEPRHGPWIDQHPLLVERRGTAFCMECHVPTHCVDCHTVRVKTIESWNR